MLELYRLEGTLCKNCIDCKVLSVRIAQIGRYFVLELYRLYYT